MKRLLAIAFVTFVAGDASAQCAPKIDLNAFYLDGVSHGLWRGIDLGGKIYAEPRLEVGLCGRPSTTLGTQGADLTLEGWVPVSNGGTDVASARARYLWYFREDKETSIAAGLRETHWSAGGGARPWTSELSIEARTKWHIEKQGFNAHPFVEVARDFNRFKATYARGGIDLTIDGTSTVPYDLDASAFLSASNYAGDFGSHDAEVLAWVYRRVANDQARIAIGAGYARVATDIGRSRGWIGVRIKLFYS